MLPDACYAARIRQRAELRWDELSFVWRLALCMEQRLNPELALGPAPRTLHAALSAHR